VVVQAPPPKQKEEFKLLEVIEEKPLAVEERKETPENQIESAVKPAIDTVNSGVPKHILDNFTILQILGKGFGTIYKLEDVNHTKYTLRVVRKRDYSEEDREDIASKISSKFYVTELNHPNIIKFFE